MYSPCVHFYFLKTDFSRPGEASCCPGFRGSFSYHIWFHTVFFPCSSPRDYLLQAGDIDGMKDHRRKSWCLVTGSDLVLPPRSTLGFLWDPLRYSWAPPPSPCSSCSCSKQILFMSSISLHCVWGENVTGFQAALFAHLLLRAHTYIKQVTWRNSGDYIKSHGVTQQSLVFWKSFPQNFSVSSQLPHLLSPL